MRFLFLSFALAVVVCGVVYAGRGPCITVAPPSGTYGKCVKGNCEAYLVITVSTDCENTNEDDCTESSVPEAISRAVNTIRSPNPPSEEELFRDPCAGTTCEVDFTSPPVTVGSKDNC